MADRQNITPRMLAKNMYAPEDSADYRGFMTGPNDYRDLIDAALQASMVIPAGGAAAAGTRALEAAPGALAKAGQYARSLETASGGISPVELAVKQAKYPGRFINPQTGAAQNISGGILTGRAEPAMGAVRDPFAGMIRGVEEAPANIRSYLTEAQPVVNPDTGYQLQQIMPGGKFGPGLTEWTAGQRAARTGIAAAPLVPAAMMSLPSDMGSVGSGRGSINEQPGERYAAMAGPGRGIVNEQPGERYAGTVGPGRGSIIEDPNARAAYTQQDAINAAKQRMAGIQATGERAGLPPARPTDTDGGLLSKIFSGKDYQSNAQLVNTPMDGAPVNWGSSDSAADFFRADKALSQMKAQQAADAAAGTDDNRKRGGMVSGKGQGQSEKMPDPIHKALEIIHHLLIRH